MPSPRLRLRIAASAERALRNGHPWIYADRITAQNRPGATGELAVVYDRQDQFLAIGLYDPESPIRLRVLHSGKPQTIGAAFWAARLDQALQRRHGLFDEQTTGYRWINGESDGWPGLVLDRYDTTLVLKLYTGAWLPRLDEIAGLIGARLHPDRLVLRLSRNLQTTAREAFGKSDGEILNGPALAEPVVFLESGLRFEADVLRGQKTGFFLDQRENRRQVGALAGGREVLNAFSFSGAFSLSAARGGARSVTNLDVSRHALESAKRNFALNQANPVVARCRHETAQADVFDWLGSPPKAAFDLIVLDPPSFARREPERPGALRAYEQLAGLGIRCLSPGGILVACSCSAHVTADEFFGVIRQAARKSRRRFEALFTTGHAPDHPAAFKEAEYLKAIYLRF